MKKFNLFILFLSLIPSLCFGGWYYSKVESGSPAYLIDENFSGGSTPSGWTDAGTPTYNSGNVVFDYNDRTTTVEFTGQTDVYIGMQVNFAALENTGDLVFIRILDTSDTILGYVAIRAADTVRAANGSGITTGSTIATGTHYIWVSFSTALGASNTYTVDIGSTGTFSSATSYIDASNGTSTADIAKIRIGQESSDSSGDVTYYQIIVDDAAIGDLADES